MAVAPGHRRRGVARALLEQVIDSGSAGQLIELTTAPDNIAMQTLATSMGFRGVRFVSDYFGPGEDRLVMHRLPFRDPDMPSSTFHLPVGVHGELATALGEGYSIIAVVELTHGEAWQMARSDESMLMDARANESSVAVGFSSVVLGAIAFLLGFGFASDRFPTDLLAVLSVALVVSMVSMLVYANTTGELTSMQLGSFNRAMGVGNVLSEFGGVYPVFHVVPVTLAAITSSVSAGLIACLGASLASFAYQRSPFNILGRYRDRRAVFMAFTVWLVVAPVVGFASYWWAGTTTAWALLDLLVLGVITTYCIQREESIRKVG